MKGNSVLTCLNDPKRPIVLAAIFFVLGGIVTPFLSQSVSALFKWFLEVRAAPQVVMCAPLQESRLIVRSDDEIIHDVEYGFPNDTLTSFQAGRNMLENVELLIYPLGRHQKMPILYYANVQTSDRMAIDDSTVKVEDSYISLQMPFLKAQEIVFIDLMFGQPVALLMEVRADDYSERFTGVPGCPDAPQSISSPPTENMFEYFFSECGENGDERCGIPATPGDGLQFEAGVVPQFEEVIIRHNKRVYRTQREK